MRLEQCSGCLRTGAGELFCSRKLYGNGGTCGRCSRICFNEYLQVAIAWGIPVLCIGLLILSGSMYIGHKQGIYGLCGALLSLAVFAFSSYPLQFPAFVSALIILVLACGIRVLPLEKVWPRILFTVLLLIGSYGCFCKYQQKSKTVEACKQWTKSRMFYTRSLSASSRKLC